MPYFRLNVTIDQKGMIFDTAQSKAAAARMVIGVNERIAQVTFDRIHARLNNVLKNPTGYYQSRIVIERREIYRGVSDSNVVYGGWLERGRAGTRFRGYSTFRIVRDQVSREKAQIAQPLVDQFIQEMNQ